MNIIPTIVSRRIEHRPNLLKIIDNIGWLFFDKILRMGGGVLVGVWIARYLGPQQFGLLNFATAFVSLFDVIAGLGLQGVVVRDIVRDPACKEETLGTAAGLQLIGGLLAYSLILGAIFWMRPDDALSKTLVAILGSTMLFKASEVAVYWFESQVQSKYTVWVQNSIYLIFSAIKVGLILQESPLIVFVWVILAEVALVALILMVVMDRRGLTLANLNATADRAKSLLKDSWPLIFSSLSVMIYMRLDQIMLGQIIDDAAVGIYSAAVKISEIWYFIPLVIVASVFPTILQTQKQSELLYRARLQRLLDLLVIIGCTIAFPLAFFAGNIINILYGPTFSESARVLSIHISGSVFIFLAVVGNKWYLAINRQDLALRRDLLGAAVNIVMNVFLIPSYGASGAAASTVLSYFIAHLLMDYFSPSTRDMFFMKLRALNIIGSSYRILRNNYEGVL